MQNILNKAAETFTLYPIIINIGAPISSMIAGIKKMPGTPKDSIQPTVPSQFPILLIPLNKKIREISYEW